MALTDKCTKPDDILEECRKLFEAKNKEKGDGYKRGGEIIKALFPNGIHLRGKDSLNIYNNLIHIIDCLSRITNILSISQEQLNYELSEGIDQTAVDLTVYSAMLVSLLRWKDINKSAE